MGSQQEWDAIYAMGPRGSYSYEAAVKAQTRISTGRRTSTNVLCTTSIAEAVHLANERTELAIIPVENTTSGLVLEGLLALRYLKNRNIVYKGDFWLPVEHKVLGRSGLGQEWDGVLGVLTHPHAAAQCSKYLTGLSVPVMPTMSTAEAACLVATSDRYYRYFAIASGAAAKEYGLTVYKEDIADRLGNKTRFQLYGNEFASISGAEEKSVLCITLRNRPRAIAWLGAAIGYEGVGINALHALPTGSPYAYDFYVEFACHIYSERGKRIWASLKDISTYLTLLGSVPGS